MTEKLSKQKTKYQLLGFDSSEEFYFDAWLQEIGAEYEYKPKTFVLCEPVKLKQQKQRSIGESHLLNGATYQPDFIIYTIRERIGDILLTMDISVDIIQQSLKDAVLKTCFNHAHVDVKGSNFKNSNRSSDVQFSTKQKWMFKEFGIYINSVVPDDLFEKTFAPEVYFYTEKGAERCRRVKNELVPLSKLLKKLKDVL